jgi:hypothetical protein
MGSNEVVHRSFAETFKPSTRLIETHQPFPKKIGIMGHSLSIADLLRVADQ